MKNMTLKRNDCKNVQNRKRVNIRRSFPSTVSNKKTHLADFEICVFRVYLRNHLSCKKSYFHLFTSLSEELSDEKNNFSNLVTKSADI